MSQQTIEQLKPQVKTAIVDLLYRLADDHLILGHRNSEWTGLGPILEADIAFSSMAQDKMGHALAFYRLLQQLGEPDPDTNAFLRSGDQYRCCSLVCLERGDWAQSVVRHFLFDEATRIRFEALEQSRYEPLAQVARKLRGELKYHTMHGQMNLDKLGDATEESHQRMQDALDRLFPHAMGVFEPTEWDETLAAEGIQPREAELCKTWRSQVADMCAESGLTMPDDVGPIYGGRAGKHPEDLKKLLDDMQKVYRLDPDSEW
ncbi:MAG: phenylacetate-CoA oxygenase subunit PaaC [Phycisphaerales bacterium]|nr:phenylacetate-CoA oxygenase subunit PaaC [Phycisphaerales bacterium]